MQVLDVQQARGTLEDVSTNLRVAVLAKFDKFGVTDPNCSPMCHSNPKPAAASASDSALSSKSQFHQNSMGPG